MSVPAAPLGLGAVWKGSGRVAFRVWAPSAERVDLVLYGPPDPAARAEAPGRAHALEQGRRGYWSGEIAGIEAGALYRYRLDGGEALADPASRHQPFGVHGPSQVVDPAFSWTDETWRGVALRDYVLYEIHVGTFTPGGTFDDVIPRLDELADLGVTVIELMPVAQFPGRRNWGYDGVFPFAVQNSYGGPEGLRRLVDAAHARGLAVALDVVYNHLGPEGTVLHRFGPYLSDRYATPWGQALNFDGRGSDEVRGFFLENALHWMREYHVDSLRLDAVDAILDRSAAPFLEELGRAVHAEGDRLQRTATIIAESDANDPRFVEGAERGGLGLDAVWSVDFHRALHAALTGERQGYYGDFPHVDLLAVAYRQGFVYAGRRSDWRGRRHGRTPEGIPDRRFVVYAQTHDQIGNRTDGNRLSALVDFESLKLAAAAVLLSPYLPLLFMGEEYGETSSFRYFIDHGDPMLNRAVREGRRREFASLGWDGDVPDPAEEGTFAGARIDWGRRREGNRRLLLELHRELLRLRRRVPPLAHVDDEAREVEAEEEGPHLVVRRRAAGGQEAALLLHLGLEARELDLALPPGRWRRLLDTADASWGGPGSPAPMLVESEGARARVRVGPRSAILLFREAPDGSR